MKWSWKLARIAGIDIYIHVTFLLLIYLVGISYWNQHGTIEAVSEPGSGTLFTARLPLRQELAGRESPTADLEVDL